MGRRGAANRETGESARADRLRRVRRPWRVVLLLYAVALEIGTHWPRLQLGTEEFRVSDKLLHAAAFGAAATLLWLSGVVRTPWLLLFVGATWALLNELTQGIPILGRTTSWVDAAASAIGVAAVAAGVWAFAPTGRPGGTARTAQRRRAWALERALSEWSAVGLCALGATAVAPVGALLGWLIFSLPRIERPEVGVELGAFLGLGTGALMVMEILRRRVLVRAERLCFECDADALASPGDAAAPGVCPRCAAPWTPQQWAEPPVATTLSATRLVCIALLAAAAFVVVAFFGTLAAGWAALHLRSPILSGLAATLLGGGGPETYDMRLLVEFLWIVLIGAVSIRVTRLFLARAIDRQHERCLRCRFDLRGASVEEGRGRCPECGQEFVGGGEAPGARRLTPE